MSPARAAVTWYRTGLLLLTGATGAIDAVSYLALDRVFTGNMTGNVLFVGFALAGVEAVPLVNNAVALLGFVLGSVVGGRLVGRGHPAGLTRAGAWTLVGSAVLVLALATSWWVAGDLATPALLTLTGLLAASMGAQVAAVKPIGNADITTVVVTSTLANLARDSRLAGGRQPTPHAAADRLLAVVVMGAGALVGAAVTRWQDGAVALGVSALVLGAGAGALALGRRAQRRPEPAVEVPVTGAARR